jgi:phosphoesterase RecJ-like protein
LRKLEKQIHAAPVARGDSLQEEQEIVYTRIPVPQGVLDFIKEGNSFLVAGHKEPDGDCVGSQLALGALLEQLGKKAKLVSDGPWKRPEIAGFQKKFQNTVKGYSRQNTRLIVVDCSSLERTGGLEDALTGFPSLFIDHHPPNHASGLRYVNPDAPASVSLVIALWEAFDIPLTRQVAEYLLFGLCTDTGFFRHIGLGGAETLSDAQKLVAAGGSLKKTFAAINGGRSLNSLKLLGTVLTQTESYYEGRLLVSVEYMEEIGRFGRENRNSDLLYQLLQSVAGVEASVVIRQDTPENCALGLRSRDTVNVAEIAAIFGGGGHKNASGAYAEGSIAELKPRVIEAFAKCFRDRRKKVC